MRFKIIFKNVDADGDSHTSLGLDKAFNNFNLKISSVLVIWKKLAESREKTKREPKIPALYII